MEIIHNAISGKTLLDSLDMSINQLSNSISIEGLTCYAVQYKWISFVGNATIYTEGSNTGLDDEWTSVDTFLPTTGTTANRMLNVEKAGYRYVRVRYVVNSTSSGTIKVTLSGKVI
jgi:hypothetical protein